MDRQKQPKFEVYREKGNRKLWRWRFKAANGKIMADSGEGYSSQTAVKRAIDKFMRLIVGDVRVMMFRPMAVVVKK